MNKNYIINNLFCLFFLLGISNLALGQDSFFKKDFVWKDWEINKTKEDKLRLVNNLNENQKRVFLNTDSKYIENNIDSFHIIDFNADGKLDIIYYGFFNSESNSTIFYLNLGDEYKKILDVYGSIIAMSRRSIYLPVSFKILDYPCCENTTYSLKDYFPSIIDNEFRFNLISNINYIDKTEFSKDIVDTAIPFEVINEGYKLRSTPSIDGNNVVSIYNKGSLGICLATKESADRVWWLVIMFNNIEPAHTILDEGNNKGKYYSIGWMSSRFLKETR